ncbi:methyltransferase domain-containing protein [Nocardia sp. BSTN01]|uniref:class I SAM-dependent methyltransferase n=1 Tax=Nocardia sp. BSTN01 TaxID=2783665 RepID=UPI00188F315B|nr:class I SAM-dependent methyltransferase [Nocardia sp. BSTN01]MBF5002015.1 methyltransferase domain-containing protein [Nocardia sp. BSTN01]
MTTPSLTSEYATLDALETRIRTHRLYSETDDDVNASVAAALRLTGSEQLIDIGCGTSEFLALLAERGHTGRLCGLDTSQSAAAAAARLPGVAGIRAAAERIPARAGAWDFLTARHMLYHLDDPLRALREFRRVVRSGGTVCVVVNHARACARTRDLVTAVAARYGFREPPGMLNRDVDSDTGPAMMRDVFGNAEVRAFDNALVIPEPEPAIRFAESLFAFCGVAPGATGYSEVRADVEAELRRWFAANPGRRWRDPKGYTVITAIRT